MDIDYFQRCKVADLRQYIRDRGQIIGTKRKAEMVALAYALHVQNAPVVPTKQELHQQVDVDYEALLTFIVDGVSVRLDDPLKITTGWLPETVGIACWPPCTYVAISDYLLERDQRDLLTRLANDYKEGTCVLHGTIFFCNEYCHVHVSVRL